MADCLYCDIPNDDDSKEYYVCNSCAKEIICQCGKRLGLIWGRVTNQCPKCGNYYDNTGKKARVYHDGTGMYVYSEDEKPKDPRL